MTDKQKKSALGIMVLAILFVSVNLRPAISSIGPLLDTMREELSLTSSKVSLLTSVPVFCMGLFAPLAVVFNKKLGLKKSIAVLLTSIGAFTLLRGFLPTYPVLLTSAFFIGLSIAIISPLLSAMIKRNFPTRTASLIGVYSFGMGLGATLAAGLTGVFYSFSGWPTALASWGLLSIAAIILWLRVKEPAAEVAEIPMEGAAVVSPWKNRRAWYMLLFFGFQSALFFSIITWLAPIAIEKGMSIIVAGAVLTVMSTVQIACNLSIPLLLEKWPSRHLWIMVSLGFGAVGVILLMFAGGAFIWPAAICLGITLGGLFPLALMMPLDENATPDDVNSWTAMIQSGGYIISALTPFAIGLFYDRFQNHMISLSLFLGFIAILMVFAFLLKEKPAAE
ncbi:CynX/NimT family MFS transporter [Planomicrobium sp. MB-3u-38]|uniref:MFS transporter n=1 Tax=Planomicrobium sp. MB-3u-38 TaxID=2058318 RepID=UPI000C7B317C|nr:MFS transporter [Planomicrobium sp. MB-3u-38]PKH10091.1 MFS transporter [Planomicrobium sp. MB-3u-38]